MTWNDKETAIFGHYDVLALPQDTETRPLECANCLEMVNSWNLRHWLQGDFNLSHLAFACKLLCRL